MKLLIVVDMQNDFITGSLGSKYAEEIVPRVAAKIEEYKRNGNKIIFTRDTHNENYLSTQEGRKLPVEHCIIDTQGWEVTKELDTAGCEIINKPTFGSAELAQKVSQMNVQEIELVGLCTDICVISNAMLLKAFMPEVEITVDAACCGGVTSESHNTALLAMKACQINIINE